MRRRRRNRATWFPTLGFENETNDFITLDIRQLTVPATGRDVTVVPLLPDIDIPVQQSQTQGGAVVSTLRDFVEGQSCIIERVVGNIQVQGPLAVNNGSIAAYAVAAAFAVIPILDDGTGNPAISVAELDPLAADNVAQPWLWRRVWNLGVQSGSAQVGNNTGYPANNLFGSVAEGSKVDTKGTKRALRREERLFLIYSVAPLFPDPGSSLLLNAVHAIADLRILGHMVRAHNRSAFK